MYEHLALQDRESIEIHLNRWEKLKDIAKILWRSESSIWREVKRNSVRKKYERTSSYKAVEAHIKAYQRRWKVSTDSRKINLNPDMRLFIIEWLKRWDINASPKIMAHLWNKTQESKKNHITHTSIYSWLETGMWNKYKNLLLYKYRGYRKRKTKFKKVRIKGRVPIELRPEGINSREEIGHFEADLVVSKQGHKWALLTLIDRRSRYPQIFKLKDKSSLNIMNLIAWVSKALWIKSVTFDNWMEFAKHYLLKESWIDTYFCNAYSSWEKWSIENLNRIIRRTFPKGTIFDDISEKQIKNTCRIIADTPREILGFDSPNQTHFS
jgi:IS30 family transposase